MLAQLPTASEVSSGRETATAQVEVLKEFLLAIFSWVILMPVAVIVSGRWLATAFGMNDERENVFEIKIPPFVANPFFSIGAKGSQVILGFSAFLITLLLVALALGPSIPSLVKNRFGIECNHFQALSFFSSLLTVMWTAALYLSRMRMNRQPTIDSGSPSEAEQVKREHTRLITELPNQ